MPYNQIGNRLWFVLSSATADGLVAVASLTTHGRSLTCSDACIVVRPGEHPWISRDSCVCYRGALMNAVAPLDSAKLARALEQSAPCSDELLLRIQEGALNSPLAPLPVKSASRATLGR